MLALLFIGSAYADCNNPPNAWGSSGWDAYAKWCSGCGGEPDVRTTSCKPGANWGKQPMPVYRQPDMDARRRRLEQEEKAADGESRRREEEARINFNKSRQQALELMKGTGSDTLIIKSGTGFLGLKGSPGTPEGIRIKEGMPQAATDKAVRAWACAGWIADFAFAAAIKGDQSEVRFLEEQTVKVLRGEKAGVDCPYNAAPHNIHGVAIGPNATVTKFYGALLGSLLSRSSQLVESRKMVADLLAQKLVTNDEIQKLEQVLKLPPGAAAKEKTENGNEALKPVVAEKKVENPNLDAALAALKMAKEALSKIQQYQDMHKKVQENPALAEKFNENINKENKP